MITSALAPPGFALPQNSQIQSSQVNTDVWLEAITNLFTAMIVIDGKVLPIEIDTMQHVLDRELSEFGNEANAFRLDKDHARHIYKVLKGPGARYWLGNQHMKLSDFDGRAEILEKLWELAICDKKLDRNESQLIDIFSHLWRK